MPYSNGGKIAERIWARLEDFRSQQRRINKQSLWYYQQYFPVPHKGTRSPFSGEDSPTMIGLLHTPGESSHLATLPLLVHGPATRYDGLLPARAHISAKAFLQTPVREASLASMGLGDSNFATLPLLD